MSDLEEELSNSSGNLTSIFAVKTTMDKWFLGAKRGLPMPTSCLSDNIPFKQCQNNTFRNSQIRIQKSIQFHTCTCTRSFYIKTIWEDIIANELCTLVTPASFLAYTNRNHPKHLSTLLQWESDLSSIVCELAEMPLNLKASQLNILPIIINVLC